MTTLRSKVTARGVLRALAFAGFFLACAFVLFGPFIQEQCDDCEQAEHAKECASDCTDACADDGGDCACTCIRCISHNPAIYPPVNLTLSFYDMVSESPCYQTPLIEDKLIRSIDHPPQLAS